MRRKLPGRGGALFLAIAMVMLAVAPSPAAVGPSSKRKKERPPKIQETVGDLAYVVSSGEIIVEGVGLVTGLENTGADSPPSAYRKALVDEMTKAGVEHAERLLASPQLSIVMVRMVIPMGVGPRDPIDVQVQVPPGCPTKSLAGGHLIATRLYAVARGGHGETFRDKEIAIARGPVMIGSVARPDDPKIGRVLGGGHVLKENPFHLVIKESREGYYTAKLLESVVNARFHQPRDGHQKGMATGKTPRYLVLDVPALYHENQARFFKVVQSIPMIDGPELRVRRTAEWGKELLDPKTAGSAAVKLEALGNGSIDALKKGLESNDPRVKFFSAESLAYLNETAGVEALGEAAIKLPEFRPYALAALAALDQSASHIVLRKLMDQPDILVRYGAFSALRTLDPSDGYLGRVGVLDAPKVEEDDEPAGDAMAMEITAAARRRLRPDDPFALYLVDSDGPPMVHVSRTRRSEIVVFGRRQKLLPPIVLDQGEVMVNASENDEVVELSRIVPATSGESDVKVRSSLEVAEVIRRVANLGATYPQIVGLLEKSSKQKNLPGLLVIDAVPVAGPTYLEAIAGLEKPKKDDAIDRTSGDAQWWQRLPGLRLLRRDHDTNPAPMPSAPSTAKANSAPAAELPPLPEAPAPSTGTATATGPRRDEAVKQTAGSSTTPAVNPAEASSSPSPATGAGTSSPPRRRFLDFLRREQD